MTGKEILQKYRSPENFFNRDLSWTEFNRRVLEEALDPELPVLEKVKFVSIFSSNLDEFYMIRVAGIKEQIAAKVLEPTIDGLTPSQELEKIDSALRPMLAQLMDLWQNTIVPELSEHNIDIIGVDELSEQEQETVTEYFKQQIYPVLTPLATDPGRPFPYISNLSLSLAVLIRDPKGESHFARIKVPSILPRLLQVDTILDPGRKAERTEHFSARFIWLGDLIKDNLHLLFPKMEILEAHRFRITRDTDIEIQEDEADDLLQVIEENIKQRRFGNVVRLEVEKSMPEFMLDTLVKNLRCSNDDVHIVDGPLGLSSVMELYSLPVHQIKQKPFYPQLPKLFEEEEDIFSTIKKRDVLLHHPYDSFTPVIDFIKKASLDPNVLAIKQTLYRVGSNSPVVKALIDAAELKKQVAVLVELKARFDEENNIFWARELEKAGVHVVYGLVGLKTHSKMTLVVRRESGGVKRYVHLGTGNYNASTAKLYTDLGVFTDNEEICSDVSDVFNYLTGYSEQSVFNKLFVSPINVRTKMIDLISREIENYKQGGKGRIIMKMNSLVDPTIIAALYEASNEGVEVQLIIRGICCLVPGVPGLSENIRVTSIVGRFLEHSRIYYFHNNGDDLIYISSADMMQRNLDRRVEAVVPIESKDLKDYLKNIILNISLKDNVKARLLNPDMSYTRLAPKEGEEPINSQEWLMKHTYRVAATYLSK